MKAIILAGGLGTRLREETEYRPKAMVEIGGLPIIWHLMKILSTQGINDFIVCLGYRGEVIRDYFINYEGRRNDVTIQLGINGSLIHESKHDEEKWTVTLVDTGHNTQTAARLARVQKYVGKERVLVTYGDGIANINIEKLLKFHDKLKKLATLTAVQPTSRFGALKISVEGIVESFEEKPKTEDWVNGGFMIFEPEVFNRFTKDEPLEQSPLQSLCQENQLSAYRHNGFWQPMDTYREYLDLNRIWSEGSAPWKIW